MSISNKTFKNNRTGETIKVIDSFEDIAILENKGKEKVSNLMNPELYTEQIDVSSFFNTQGAYNLLADKIKNIPADKIKDEPGQEVIINIDGNTSFSPTINESAIIEVSEESERAELARKYGVETNSQNEVTRQNEAFAKLLAEGEEEVVVSNSTKTQQVMNEIPKTQVPQAIVEDPIITMFRNVKRNKDFSISLEIKNKIPRPDFIEMMEDSYNTSIIDFLASEFTDNLLKNPQVIEDMIKQKIKEVVYGVESFPTPVNDQITDSVTQVKNEKHDIPKKTTTRKPRPNTAQGEKPGYKAPSRNSKKETSK
jgi:hypothetical protein